MSRAQVLGFAFLWAACMSSAFGVVWSTHSSRQQVNALEELRREGAGLQVEWGQYLLEQSTWAAYNRVEQIATQRLGMEIPDPEKIVMVNK